MRVADVVVRARGDHQLAFVIQIVAEAFAWPMEEEREAPLEAGAHVGTSPLPGSPLREPPDSLKVVAVGKFLEQKVGKRRGRLANGEPRMTSALDEHDTASDAAQGERGQ